MVLGVSYLRVLAQRPTGCCSASYSYRQLAVRIVVTASRIPIFRRVDNLLSNSLQIVHWPNYKLDSLANSIRGTYCPIGLCSTPTDCLSHSNVSHSQSVTESDSVVTESDSVVTESDSVSDNLLNVTNEGRRRSSVTVSHFEVWVTVWKTFYVTFLSITGFLKSVYSKQPVLGLTQESCWVRTCVGG